MRTKKSLVPLLAIPLAVEAAYAWGGAFRPQDPPGPLSAAHAMKAGCADCHDAAGQADPKKCLACHVEIASRIAAQRGYHRDKGGDCAVCHTEHQGRESSIVPLDPAGFDHAETGAQLGGVHRVTPDCGACHTPANTIPRSRGRSYLFRVEGCRACHRPPHPGRQENCQACHGQETWSVDKRPPKG